MASHNAVAYLMRKQIQSKLDEINKEVFENPSASLDPTLFPQPQDPVEEFRWDEYPPLADELGSAESWVATRHELANAYGCRIYRRSPQNYAAQCTA